MNKAFLLYAAKRLSTYVLTLFVALTVTFLLYRLIPGNPLEAYTLSMADMGQVIPLCQEMIDQYKKDFNLEGSIFSQYMSFLRELMLHQNLGPSLISFPTPAQVLIARALPWSISLVAVSILISWTLGNVIGALAGWLKDRKISQASLVLGLFFSQIPSYFSAILLVLIFGYALAVLPTWGAYYATSTPGLNLKFILDVITHAILPSLSLIIVSFFGWMISMRSIIISILGEDYLLFAEAKGLPKRKIFTRYVMRNALLPQVTALGITLGFTVNGSLLVEYIFVYPGIGTLFSQALSYLDYNTIMGCILMSIFTVLTANLIVEFLYPLIDPRVRTGVE